LGNHSGLRFRWLPAGDVVLVAKLGCAGLPRLRTVDINHQFHCGWRRWSWTRTASRLDLGVPVSAPLFARFPQCFSQLYDCLAEQTGIMQRVVRTLMMFKALVTCLRGEHVAAMSSRT
jgi:hypothetical protein